MLTFMIILQLIVGLICASRFAKERAINVMLFGDAAVGKTCLAERITTGQFHAHSIATIGANSYSIVLPTSQLGQKVALNLWDTAGQERFAPLASFYYRSADIALILYSVDSKVQDAYYRIALIGRRQLKGYCPASTNCSAKT